MPKDGQSDGGTATLGRQRPHCTRCTRINIQNYPWVIPEGIYIPALPGKALCFPEGFSGAFPGALPHRQPAGWLQHQGMLIGGAGNEEVRAGAPQGSVAGLVLT